MAGRDTRTTAKIVASVKSRIVTFPGEEVRTLMQESPAFEAAFLRALLFSLSIRLTKTNEFSSSSIVFKSWLEQKKAENAPKGMF